ncbi:hypothetical protein RRG08_044493 [Elysia crispata]|uniref:Uncharacterized protein n=1 Tax=Elysia crispata TaxID=231223 RepID=A0AAE0ZDB8_9GAST|nr:hypothetical protein RRG08_044493 [Elysia crispata]
MVNLSRLTQFVSPRSQNPPLSQVVSLGTESLFLTQVISPSIVNTKLLWCIDNNGARRRGLPQPPVAPHRGLIDWASSPLWDLNEARSNT